MGEVREAHGSEPRPVDAVLSERVRRDLHRDRRHAASRMLREQGLELGRLRRRVRRARGRRRRSAHRSCRSPRPGDRPPARSPPAGRSSSSCRSSRSPRGTSSACDGSPWSRAATRADGSAHARDLRLGHSTARGPEVEPRSTSSATAPGLDRARRVDVAVGDGTRDAREAGSRACTRGCRARPRRRRPSGRLGGRRHRRRPGAPAVARARSSPPASVGQHRERCLLGRVVRVPGHDASWCRRHALDRERVLHDPSEDRRRDLSPRERSAAARRGPRSRRGAVEPAGANPANDATYSYGGLLVRRLPGGAGLPATCSPATCAFMPVPSATTAVSIARIAAAVSGETTRRAAPSGRSWRLPVGVDRRRDEARARATPSFASVT